MWTDRCSSRGTGPATTDGVILARTDGAALRWELPDDTLPVHPLRRRVERAVEGGRTAVPGGAREVERLRAVLPRAAELSLRLENASRPGRDAFGRVVADASGDFAAAWLACATYVAAALRSAEHDDWVRST